MRRSLFPDLPQSAVSHVDGLLARIARYPELDGLPAPVGYGEAAERLRAEPASGERPWLRGVFLDVLDQGWQEHRSAQDFMRNHGYAIYPGGPDEVLHAYRQDAHRRFLRVVAAMEPAARQIVSNTPRQGP